MKGRLFVISLIALLKVALYAQENTNIEKEKEAIKKVIQEAFVDGMENFGDIESIKRGFHPDYCMYYIRNNELTKVTLDACLKNVQQLKQQNPAGPADKASIKFLSVDVYGAVGIAAFEQYKKSKLVYTDILILMKFEEGWRIMGKLFQRHG